MPPFLRKILRSINSWSIALGLDLRKCFSGITSIPWYFWGYHNLRTQIAKSGSPWTISCNAPCLHDRKEESGVAKGHYFHQDLVVAQRIFKRAPRAHVDVGSRIDGFVAHVASFSRIEVFDLRPLISTNANIIFRQLDITSIPASLVDYTDSLSCLHALEHFGLGRYGDILDLTGYESGFEGLYRMLRSGGILYFSVPIGRERIAFNSHRVYSLETLKRLFANRFEVLSFAFVDDNGDLASDIPFDANAIERCKRANYACGIFELRKI